MNKILYALVGCVIGCVVGYVFCYKDNRVKLIVENPNSEKSFVYDGGPYKIGFSTLDDSVLVDITWQQSFKQKEYSGGVVLTIFKGVSSGWSAVDGKTKSFQCVSDPRIDVKQ